MGGFRITANQVTVARLIPMPLISWWVYQRTEGHLWTAIIVGTIIGSTDFVDGYLARRQGPTVLGGLLDPIADKVFVAFCYMPFADMGMVPAWACALMFVREFLVTALRSAYERRELSLKTSYLAKAKTWTQMQGIGVMMLFPLIGARPLMTYLLLGGIAAPLVAMAALWFIRRKVWRGAFIMSGSFVALYLVHRHGDPLFTMNAIMVGVVAITWISAFDYFAIGFRQLRGRGDLDRADAVRIAGSLALPILVFAVLVETPSVAWPLFTVISLELAVGGLDNLLSHHRQASGAAPWGTRQLGASALLGTALLVPAQASVLAIAAAALSLTGVAWEAWRGRDYYLDARLRDKAIRA
ncbi:MAG: CDP-alcohol phosphatidyltransferase family protein [Kofleriaceae bacterium]